MSFSKLYGPVWWIITPFAGSQLPCVLRLRVRRFPCSATPSPAPFSTDRNRSAPSGAATRFAHLSCAGQQSALSAEAVRSLGNAKWVEGHPASMTRTVLHGEPDRIRFDVGQNVLLQSEYLIALVALTGTVVGAGLGMRGPVLAARSTSRAQFDGQMAHARREAYHACAQAFIARQAVLYEYFRLLHNVALPVEMSAPDAGVQQANWREYCQLRDSLKKLNVEVHQALGAVAVVGTPDVWHQADFTSGFAEDVYERLHSRFSYFREQQGWGIDPMGRTTWAEIDHMLTTHNEALLSFLDMCNATLSPEPRRWFRSSPSRRSIIDLAALRRQRAAAAWTNWPKDLRTELFATFCEQPIYPANLYADRPPYNHAEYREHVTKPQIELMRTRGIWRQSLSRIPGTAPSSNSAVLGVAFCGFHVPAEAERPHVRPDLPDVLRALILAAGLPGGLPAERGLLVLRPQRVLLFVVHHDHVDLRVLVARHVAHLFLQLP